MGNSVWPVNQTFLLSLILTNGKYKRENNFSQSIFKSLRLLINYAGVKRSKFKA